MKLVQNILKKNGVLVERFSSSNPKFIEDIEFIDDYNKCTSSSLKLIVDKEIILAGNMNFSANIKLENFTGGFEVNVIFPNDYPSSIPKAINVNNKVSAHYKHFLEDGSLCLGVPTDLYYKINHEDSIEFFLKKILIPYYLSYKYWDENNGLALFDERSHGIKGVIEFYLEHFQLKSRSSLYQLFDSVECNSLKENILCPCGSGLIYQNCHHKQIKELIKTPFFKNDCTMAITNQRLIRLRLYESMNSVIQKK